MLYIYIPYWRNKDDYGWQEGWGKPGDKKTKKTGGILKSITITPTIDNDTRTIDVRIKELRNYGSKIGGWDLKQESESVYTFTNPKGKDITIKLGPGNSITFDRTTDNSDIAQDYITTLATGLAKSLQEYTVTAQVAGGKIEEFEKKFKTAVAAESTHVAATSAAPATIADPTTVATEPAVAAGTATPAKTAAAPTAKSATPTKPGPTKALGTKTVAPAGKPAAASTAKAAPAAPAAPKRAGAPIATQRAAKPATATSAQPISSPAAAKPAATVKPTPAATSGKLAATPAATPKGSATKPAVPIKYEVIINPLNTSTLPTLSKLAIQNSLNNVPNKETSGWEQNIGHHRHGTGVPLSRDDVFAHTKGKNITIQQTKDGALHFISDRNNTTDDYVNTVVSRYLGRTTEDYRVQVLLGGTENNELQRKLIENVKNIKAQEVNKSKEKKNVAQGGVLRQKASSDVSASTPSGKAKAPQRQAQGTPAKRSTTQASNARASSGPAANPTVPVVDQSAAASSASTIEPATGAAEHDDVTPGLPAQSARETASPTPKSTATLPEVVAPAAGSLSHETPRPSNAESVEEQKLRQVQTGERRAINYVKTNDATIERQISGFTPAGVSNIESSHSSVISSPRGAHLVSVAEQVLEPPASSVPTDATQIADTTRTTELHGGSSATKQSSTPRIEQTAASIPDEGAAHLTKEELDSLDDPNSEASVQAQTSATSSTVSKMPEQPPADVPAAQTSTENLKRLQLKGSQRNSKLTTEESPSTQEASSAPQSLFPPLQVTMDQKTPKVPSALPARSFPYLQGMTDTPAKLPPEAVVTTQGDEQQQTTIGSAVPVNEREKSPEIPTIGHSVDTHGKSSDQAQANPEPNPDPLFIQRPGRLPPIDPKALRNRRKESPVQLFDLETGMGDTAATLATQSSTLIFNLNADDVFNTSLTNELLTALNRLKPNSWTTKSFEEGKLTLENKTAGTAINIQNEHPISCTGNAEYSSFEAMAIALKSAIRDTDIEMNIKEVNFFDNPEMTREEFQSIINNTANKLEQDSLATTKKHIPAQPELSDLPTARVDIPKRELEQAAVPTGVPGAAAASTAAVPGAKLPEMRSADEADEEAVVSTEAEIVVEPDMTPTPTTRVWSSTAAYLRAQQSPFKDLDNIYILQQLRNRFTTSKIPENGALTWNHGDDSTDKKSTFVNSDEEKITIEPILTDDARPALRVTSSSGEQTAFASIASIRSTGKDPKRFKYTLTADDEKQAQEMINEYINQKIDITQIKAIDFRDGTPQMTTTDAITNKFVSSQNIKTTITPRSPP